MKEMRASEATGQFLDGLDYPIDRSALLTAAREAKLADEAIAALAKLPERTYEDAEDVTNTLNAST